MLEKLHKFPLWELEKSKIESCLSKICKEIRQKNSNEKFLGIFHANELNRSFVPIATCGLQKDIIKYMADGILSFNKSWTSEVNLSQSVTRLCLPKASTSFAKQLDAIFRNHKILEFQIAIVKCAEYEYIVFLEANRKEGMVSFVNGYNDDALIYITEKIYLSHLRSYKDLHLNDWEKAVHELASPLDFIYSNSDFLIHYLNRADVTYDLKIKKLKDLKLISDLLINRLHQFRFAFAETLNYKVHFAKLDLYKLMMPITHLWYHEASRKKLRFQYDELRDISINSDSQAIQFITFNLVSNAIKYSNEKTEIQLYPILENESVKFGIRNYGLPIYEKEFYKIFELGYRSEEAKSRDARGLGVGLYVCRLLAKEIGGNIKILSGSGNPTTFEVEIPNK